MGNTADKLLTAAGARALLPEEPDIDCSADPSTGHKQDTNVSILSYIIDFIGAPKGNRTPVFAVKGRRPRPLDDGRTMSPTASTKRGDL